jgi:hypothetical protein
MQTFVGCSGHLIVYHPKAFVMKKILFLLCVYTAMGFTTATEKQIAEAAAEAAPKKLIRTYGYIETTSPEAYTLTLQ